MTITNWSSEVNTKFYSYSKKPQDNTVVSSFISGRVTGFKRNTRQIMTFSCKLRVTKAEEDIFWIWVDQMGACLGAWQCSDLGAGYFRFVSVPSPDDTDQKYTVLNMEIEQVY